jgi:hypothetical protein
MLVAAVGAHNPGLAHLVMLLVLAGQAVVVLVELAV